MSKHILLELANRKPYNEQLPLPEGISFDYTKGYWMNSNQEPYVNTSTREGLEGTKKCDQETGEDMKGE